MTERQGPRVTFDKKKPAYYQAGRGRGALGFGTSSALPFSDTKFGQVPSGYVAGRGRAMGALARSQGEVSSKGGSVRDGGDTNQSSSAFSSQLSRFNDEDNEADKIYAQIGQMIKSKKRKNVKPIGFAIGDTKLYLTNTDGKMIVVDLNLGKVTAVEKVSGNFTSRPFIFNQSLFVIRNGSIIQYN